MSLSLEAAGVSPNPPSAFCAETSQATVLAPGDTPAERSASTPNVV